VPGGSDLQQSAEIDAVDHEEIDLSPGRGQAQRHSRAVPGIDAVRRRYNADANAALMVAVTPGGIDVGKGDDVAEFACRWNWAIPILSTNCDCTLPDPVLPRYTDVGHGIGQFCAG